MLGLMGVGKTTVGRSLAQALGWPVIDSDEAISRRWGETVRELAERLGNDEMHHVEAEQLLEALRETPGSVICAAASVVDDPGCRRALEQPGVFAVWLQGRAETLAQRFATGPHRPIYGPDQERVFRQQLGKRSRWFAEVAQHRVSVDGRSPQEIVEDILSALASEDLTSQH